MAVLHLAIFILLPSIIGRKSENVKKKKQIEGFYLEDVKGFSLARTMIVLCRGGGERVRF